MKDFILWLIEFVVVGTAVLMTGTVVFRFAKYVMEICMP